MPEIPAKTPSLSPETFQHIVTAAGHVTAAAVEKHNMEGDAIGDFASGLFDRLIRTGMDCWFN